MKTLPPALRRFSHLNPAWLAWAVLIAIAFWLGQTLITLLVDSPIPFEAVQAQQIRLKTGQLENFQSTLTAYQQPPAPKSLPSTLVSPGETED